MERDGKLFISPSNDNGVSSCMKYTVVYTAHDNEEYQEEFTDLKKAKKYAKGLEERGFKNVSIN